DRCVASLRPAPRRSPYSTLFRSGVEVVRRLVEEQRLHAGEEDARELDAAALPAGQRAQRLAEHTVVEAEVARDAVGLALGRVPRSEEHTSELQSRENLVCRLLLE